MYFKWLDHHAKFVRSKNYIIFNVITFSVHFNFIMIIWSCFRQLMSNYFAPRQTGCCESESFTFTRTTEKLQLFYIMFKWYTYTLSHPQDNCFIIITFASHSSSRFIVFQTINSNDYSFSWHHHIALSYSMRGWVRISQS